MEETLRNENPVYAEKAVGFNSDNAINEDAEKATDEPLIGEQNDVDKIDEMTETQDDDQVYDKSNKNTSKAQASAGRQTLQKSVLKP